MKIRDKQTVRQSLDALFNEAQARGQREADLCRLCEAIKADSNRVHKEAAALGGRIDEVSERCETLRRRLDDLTLAMDGIRGQSGAPAFYAAYLSDELTNREVGK